MLLARLATVEGKLLTVSRTVSTLQCSDQARDYEALPFRPVGLRTVYSVTNEDPWLKVLKPFSIHILQL